MATKAPEATATAAEAEPRAARRPPRPLRGAARVAAVLAPAVPPLAVAADELARGWRPTSDDAAIAWRTFDVFSVHAPLVGAFNDATVQATRPVFDLGPLQYYLLAVPVRIDPVHGLLWGAALLAGLLAAVSVEASWRAGGPLAGATVAAGWLVLAATQTRVLLNLPWNPNIGLCAFGTALVLSLVVATGRTGWWPLAVLAGSLAAQCHLVFAASALAAAAGGLGLGLLSRPSTGRRASHVVLGLVVGALSLLAPAVQQLTSHPGNLTLLLRDLERHGQRLGPNVGLEAIGRASLIPPAWVRPAPAIHGSGWYPRFLEALFTGSPAAGLAVAVAAFALGLAAYLLGHRGAGATGILAALSAGALVWTFSGIASSQAAILTYTDVVLWPVGMALDAGIVACAVVLAAEAARRVAATGRRARAVPRWRGRVATSAVAWGSVAWGAVPLALAPLLAWSLGTALPATSTGDAVIGGWAAARATGPLAARILQETPASRCAGGGRGLVVEPGVGLFPNGLDTWSLVEAIAYQLKADGCGQARLLPPMAPELGPDAGGSLRSPAWLIVPVAAHGSGAERWRAVFVRHARPFTLFGVAP